MRTMTVLTIVAVLTTSRRQGVSLGMESGCLAKPREHTAGSEDGHRQGAYTQSGSPRPSWQWSEVSVQALGFGGGV